MVFVLDEPWKNGDLDPTIKSSLKTENKQSEENFKEEYKITLKVLMWLEPKEQTSYESTSKSTDLEIEFIELLCRRFWS